MSTDIFEDYNSTYKRKKKYKMWTVVRNLLGLAFAVKLTVNIFQKENFPGRWKQEQNVFRWLGMIMQCSNVTIFKENTRRTAEASKKVHNFSLLYFVFYVPLPYITYLIDPRPISKSPAFFPWAGHEVRERDIKWFPLYFMSCTMFPHFQKNLRKWTTIYLASQTVPHHWKDERGSAFLSMECLWCTPPLTHKYWERLEEGRCWAVIH